MKPVTRDEILDYATYEDVRPSMRADVMKIKQARRVRLGQYLTFLFENHETVRYQILEMVRAERMVRERDIAHEIETYNELLGGPGELGCTLLVEIDSPEERKVKLTEWRDLPDKIYVRLASGRRVYATFDPRQRDDARLSAVQFLKLDTRGETPVAVGCKLAPLRGEVEFSEAQRQALADDLTG